MDALNLMLLIALSAIWGGSFIFMRHLSPILGAFITADMRLLIAGLFLVGILSALGVRLHFKKHWRHYLVIGIVNSGIPFLLYSFAALHIPASISVIVNSMAPLFVAIFSVFWLDEKLSIIKVSGLLLGTGGVVLIASTGAVLTSVTAILAVLACVGAACCYGLAGIYIKKHASHIKPRLVAAGSQAMVGAVMLPLAFAFPPTQVVTVWTAVLLFIFAILCSAVAYLIFYRLLSSVGPTKTLTVTFLMPAFGMLWGRLFLHETITLMMIAGTIVILLGTFLVSFEKSLRPSGKQQ
jgi:drug/metabolite transporter (DMT)-like permease